MRFKDAYGARTAVADALAWLHEEDGWSWDDLRDWCAEEIETLIEDEKDGES